ncbi:hypothetical protein ACF0H5_012841 [Mactra antiquata]
MSRSGHRSVAVRDCKRPSTDLLKKVSSALQPRRPTSSSASSSANDVPKPPSTATVPVKTTNTTTASDDTKPDIAIASANVDSTTTFVIPNFKLTLEPPLGTTADRSALKVSSTPKARNSIQSADDSSIIPPVPNNAIRINLPDDVDTIIVTKKGRICCLTIQVIYFCHIV